MSLETPDQQLRLNKFLAHEQGISRREADTLIDQGRVTINSVAARLGARFTSSDTVAIDGQPVTASAPTIYLALHKPVGYVCTRKAQGTAPTVYDLLPEQYHALKLVGRLDKDSSGIILLTNDGDFAYRMTHPKFHKIKQYEVQLDHPLEPLHQQMISDYGIQLDDGVSKFTVTRINDEKEGSKRVTVRDPAPSFLQGTKGEEQPDAGPDVTEAVSARNGTLRKTAAQGTANNYIYQVTMYEGRNRQIRRTFAALGYIVTHLHRTTFGAYSLGDISPGNHETISMR